jgi:hypothetical protein
MKTNAVEEYQDKAKEMLDAWSADISRLRASALLLEADARSEAVRQLAELEYLYGEAFQQYVVMKVNINGRLEDLRQAFEQAAAPVCEAIDQMSREVA